MTGWRLLDPSVPSEPFPKQAVGKIALQASLVQARFKLILNRSQLSDYLGGVAIKNLTQRPKLIKSRTHLFLQRLP